MNRPLVPPLVVVLALAFALLPVAPAVRADLAYLTDVEGSLAKLEGFMATCPLFERGSDGRRHLKEGAWFVHGGDVVDRFGADLRVVDELLRLKAECPDRVILVAGNRDINKIRLATELSGGAMVAGPPENVEDWLAWRKAHDAPDDRAWRLRWILERTMGAPDAFEARRGELATLMGRPPETVSDHDVVESYLNWIRPGGAFSRLLKASVLAARVGNTLFVHGSVQASNLGRLPDQKARVERVDAWVARLNRWYRFELARWRLHTTQTPVRGGIPGLPLVEYSRKLPGRGDHPFSVNYGRLLDGSGRVRLPDAETRRLLLAQGIARVVLGHTPSGQVPVLLRSPEDDFECIVADNSYGPGDGNPALVLLQGERLERSHAVGRVSAPGIGQVVPVTWTVTIGEATPLGKGLPDGSILVGRARGGLLAFRLDGHRALYRLVKGD